jgi:GNAT superfamily N-acetyltransferase
MQIRPSDAERDAEGVVALIRELAAAVITAEAWRHRVATVPARARTMWFVAEVDGAVVGRVSAGLNWLSDAGVAGSVELGVREAFRGRGIGTALWERAEEHLRALGPPRVFSRFNENDAGVRFAQARGFREVRAETVSVADPRAVKLEVAADVRPVTEFGPAEIHAIDDEATADEPAAEPMTSFPLEDWLDHVWRHPLFTRAGSFATVADGRPVAISLLTTDGAGRAGNMFTATLRAYRGRGLARAAKIASLRWAAANGVTEVFTSNDEANAPMLAINLRLGYRPFARMVVYGRESGAT